MGLISTLRRLPDLLAAWRERPVPGEDYPLSTVPIDENPVTGWAGWLMPDVQQALDGIRVGNLLGGHQLLQQMNEDPVFAHGVDTRVHAIVNTDFELVRQGGMPAKYFSALVRTWPDVFTEGDLASSAQLRVPLGVAPAQVLWGMDGDLGCWMPRRITVKDTGNLTWYQTEQRFKFSAAQGGLVTVEDDADPWVLFCELSSSYPYLQGKLRSLAVVWWIKQACLRYLNNFARVHGSPIRKVKAPASQRESADFKALIQQAQRLFGGGVFTAPQYDGPSFDLELVEARSESHSVFATAIAMADEYFTLRLLGAMDNTRGLSGQGSRARAEVHERVTNMYLGSDCKVTARVLTKVLRKWCTLNGWPVAWAPEPCFHYAPAADQQQLAETRGKNAAALSQLAQVLPQVQGALQMQDPTARVDWRRILEEHGVPLLDADEAELGGRPRPPTPLPVYNGGVKDDVTDPGPTQPA